MSSQVRRALEIDTGALEVYELAFEAGVAMETLAELIAAPLFYQRCEFSGPDEGSTEYTLRTGQAARPALSVSVVSPQGHGCG